MKKYIHPSLESGKKFYETFHEKEKVVMLNLLKFKQKADYTNFPELKPASEVSGEEAYQLYMKNIYPEFVKTGSRVVYFGKCGSFLIGPETEKWDAVLMIEYQSVTIFMEFTQAKGYLEHAGHRTAALEDSRLIPSVEL